MDQFSNGQEQAQQTETIHVTQKDSFSQGLDTQHGT